MNYNINEWQHVFKIDPAKTITDEQLERLCDSGTDAIIIGGTDNITFDNVLDLLYRVRRYAIPCALEVSEMDAITPGFDYYFIPMVFNSKDKKWFVDIQHEAIKQFKEMMSFEEIIYEGYCIVNEDAKAFTHTNCREVSKEDIVSYAYMAERIFKLPIFYVEYSGIYGDVNIVKAVKKELKDTKLFYGGGIANLEQAREMKEHSDVIVVGNSIYTDFERALETVKVMQE